METLKLEKSKGTQGGQVVLNLFKAEKEKKKKAR